MLSINTVVVLGFLFAIAIAIAVIILRWIREAEEAVETASDRASVRISSVKDGIATEVDGLSEAFETGAQSVMGRLSHQDANLETSPDDTRQ